MPAEDSKTVLHRYLQRGRDALLWKLDGLLEYDIRRPMVPTGTNLLGLVKHCTGVEIGYFGDTFGRPFAASLPWMEDDAEPNADMAGDTIDVLEQVVGGAAHLIGWSDGGIIALLVAMRRPDLVGRIVAIGANYHFDGLHPVDLDDNSSVGELIMQGYAERSPDGAEHFAELFERFQTMVTTEPTLTKDELATITAPALIMAGDDDMVRLDHTCALYEALPAGQLVIVPGTSHVLPLERPAEVARIIMDFLASEVPPATFLPIRRAR